MLIISSNDKINGVRLIELLILVLIYSCEKTVPFTYTDYTGEKGIIYDIEGNKYKTIGIGSQIWMAENLRSTRLNDNTEIKYLKDSLDWTSISVPGYCWYDNDTLLKIPYGGLYNWCAVNTEKLCPTGWHIPSEGEWRALVTRLGGENVAGGKLKVIGTDYWISPNSGATNSSKFNALPGGGVFNSHFWNLGKWGHWWSSTNNETSKITTLDLLNSIPDVLIGSGAKTYSCGLSVRCIKNHITE